MTGRLIFLHIPRTAGTTFRRILERQYPADAMLAAYDATDELSALAPEQIDGVAVVAGHFSFGVHRDLPGSWRYLTFLREPVARVVSHYHFVRGQPAHELHARASTLTLADYVRASGAAEPNNDQTRLLAGRDFASSDGTSSPEMLPAAMRNLDDHAAVGLTEAFDESLLLMGRRFGWRHPFYVPRNVGTRGRTEDLPPDVRELIGAHNSLDIELYRHGRERFARDLSEQGEAFARQLRTFKRLNGLYRFAHSRLRAARVA